MRFHSVGVCRHIFVRWLYNLSFWRSWDCDIKMARTRNVCAGRYQNMKVPTSENFFACIVCTLPGLATRHCALPLPGGLPLGTPWLRSLLPGLIRRGPVRHIGGGTMLSAPPSKSLLMGAQKIPGCAAIGPSRRSDIHIHNYKHCSFGAIYQVFSSGQANVHLKTFNCAHCAKRKENVRGFGGISHREEMPQASFFLICWVGLCWCAAVMYIF